ncbi:MAG: DUF4080 domain-containing protein [Oscillospiraceae bacterium]|nr:DUF4080 domain-containing protein [Oscillospiraceae bacterium]
MKIVLCSINSKYIHSSLGVWYLFAAAKKINTPHTVTVVESTINNQVEDIVALINREKPDVVGFSTYIWNVEYVRKVAATLKLINPNLKIWLGGSEASFDADSLLKNNYVDWVVKGEGEAAFIQMLSENFTTPAKTVVTGPCCEYINPYTPEYLAALNGRIVYLETSRGCPFSCGFCLSGRDENVRFFDMEESKKNILLLANSGTKTVKFVDRTFNCNDKRAREIFEFIAGEREKGNIPQDVVFHCEVETDLFTRSTLDYMKTLPKGLFQFEAGLQSFNVETLKAVNRRTDMPKLVHNLKEIVSGGNIHLHIDLIAGLPYEDFNSFSASFNQAYDINANVIQLGFLKLLKGSTLEKEKEKYNYRSWDYAPYQVVSCDSISYNDLLELKKCEDAVERLLNSGKFPFTVPYLIETTGLSAFDFFYKFGSFIFDSGIKSPSLEKYASLLYDYFTNHYNADKSALRDVMVKDRIITDNTGRLFGFTHVPDTNFKKITTALRQQTVNVFENQSEKAAKGKIGFAILYATNQVILADYTDQDPVTGIYNYKLIDLHQFLPVE